MNVLKGAGWFVVLGSLWLGSQGCMFVHDTDCETDSDCSTGRVCHAGTCQGPGEGGDIASFAELCSAAADAAAAKCSISYVYRQPIIDDCMRRSAAQPAACVDKYRAALNCEGSVSIWTCTEGSTTNQGTPSGCASLISAQQSCVANPNPSSGGGG